MSTSEALLSLILQLAVQLNRTQSSVPSSLNPFKSSCSSYFNNGYKEDFYYNVNNFVDRCTLASTTARDASVSNAGNAGVSDYKRRHIQGLPLYRRPPGGQDSLNQLAKECSRHQVKHPLAKDLVKFEIKAYYNHYQARETPRQNHQVSHCLIAPISRAARLSGRG